MKLNTNAHKPNASLYHPFVVAQRRLIFSNCTEKFQLVLKKTKILNHTLRKLVIVAIKKMIH